MFIFHPRTAIPGIAAFATLCMLPVLRGQEVDVRAGQTDVEINRSDVNVNVPNADERARDIQRTQREIASWLLADQKSIIDLAEFGANRTKSSEVRQLAEAIVRDHSALSEKLSQVSGERIARPRSADRDERNLAPSSKDVNARANEQREANREATGDARRNRDGVRRPLENIVDRIEDGVERVADRTERAIDAVERDLDVDEKTRSGTTPWVHIHHEIADKLTRAAQQDLEKREGFEFDASLIGMLIAAHLQQQATLEVLGKQASGNLRQTLEQAEKTVEQHRIMAEHVMKTAKR